MAQIKLPEPRANRSGSIEEEVQNLKDAYFMLNKQLTFLMGGNLDEENVVRAQEAIIAKALVDELVVGENVTMGPNAYISWDNVTGTEDIPLRTDITWENLIDKPTDLLTQSQLVDALTNYVTTGEMSDALANTLNTGNFSTVITKDYIASMNLLVGNEILMGANASLSWSQITSKPSIPNQYTDSQALNAWKNSGYATHIDANGIYSGSFKGGMFEINPLSDPVLESGITIGGWYDNGWAGQALQIKYEPQGHYEYPGTVFSSDGGVPIVFNTNVAFNDAVYFDGSHTYFDGHVDFTGANVTGLSTVAVFG